MENIVRNFSVDDEVVYKPYEDCRRADVSCKGIVIEKCADDEYIVEFGDYVRKIGWWSRGKYNWRNLFAYGTV